MSPATEQPLVDLITLHNDVHEAATRTARFGRQMMTLIEDTVASCESDSLDNVHHNADLNCDHNSNEGLIKHDNSSDIASQPKDNLGEYIKVDSKWIHSTFM